MAIQQYEVGFPISKPPWGADLSAAGLSAFDGLAALVTTGATVLEWSIGAVVSEAVALTPPFAQRWRLLAVSIAAQLVIGNKNAGTPYGKLGKIRAGLAPSINQDLVTSAGFPLPTDTQGIATIWDPASDPLPPTLGAGKPLRIDSSISLPQPVTIDPATQFSVGIWIEPQLIGGFTVIAGSYFGLAVLSATANVTYDDGLPG